jgi:hypothetical protein
VVSFIKFQTTSQVHYEFGKSPLNLKIEVNMLYITKSTLTNRMISIMIRQRPSAFSCYFVKPMYMQNLKPSLPPKNHQLVNIIGKMPKAIKRQKRHYTSFQPRKPDDDNRLWWIAIIGTFAAVYPYKKK